MHTTKRSTKPGHGTRRQLPDAINAYDYTIDIAHRMQQSGYHAEATYLNLIAERLLNLRWTLHPDDATTALIYELAEERGVDLQNDDDAWP